jgi:hypothetical protein
MSLRQVHIDELIRNFVVTLIEVITDVPANLSEFLSFLDDCVEE